jgi:predicted Zn-dependent peptidase
VAATILSWGKGSLIYRTLVRGQLAQDVVAYAFPIVVGASMMLLWVTARPGVDTHTLENATHEQIAALTEIGADDVERAVHLIETRYLAELQKVDERADLLSMHATLFDDPGRINIELNRIRAVTAADVRALARERLLPENRAVLWYVPAGAQE